ncbi:MAG: hypothetical protein PHR83_16935 [Paludibacter sp.]|nr:hypothetical protein [Paludibacter sp.]
MKNLNTKILLILVILLSSCATVTRFPVSTVTPAADIILSKQKDQNGNTKIKITATNLAAVERLSPSKNVYIVWIVSENDGVRNIGQLKNKNAKTAEIETLAPFAFTGIFITAEDQADVSYPTGIEISRIQFHAELK